jgi:inhibitor of KinA
MIPDASIHQVGTGTIEIRFERKIDPVIHDRVLRCANAVRDSSLKGINEVFITYHCVGIHVDVDSVSDLRMHLDPWVDHWLRSESKAVHESTSDTRSIHRIPVVFGGSEGPDLAELSSFAQIPESEVVRMFCEPTYRIYMTGFIGGFPYLGIVPPPIRMPRRSQPRKRVAPGTVGIAAFQAGIYPLETPGGWNLIGRTLVDIPCLHLQPGDEIRFAEVPRD